MDKNNKVTFWGTKATFLSQYSSLDLIATFEARNVPDESYNWSRYACTEENKMQWVFYKLT